MTLLLEKVMKLVFVVLFKKILQVVNVPTTNWSASL